MVKQILKNIKLNVLIIFFSITFLSSCSFNRYFYYTKSPYTDKFDKYENFTIDSRFLSINQNDSINYIIVKNAKRQTTKPTVFMIHGNGGNVSNWLDIAIPLIENDFEVVLFDYRGYGLSSGKPTHTNVLQDSNALLKRIVKEKGNVILWGLSLGGNLAVQVAIENPDFIDAIVLEAPFTGHRDIAKKFIPKLIRFVSIGIKDPYPSSKNIHKIKIPILIFVSKEDSVIPYSMGSELFNNANDPKKIVIIKGSHCRGILNDHDKYLFNFNNLINK